MINKPDPEAIAGEDFLQRNARKVFDAAPATCNEDFDCLHYHRLWPLARLGKQHGTQLAGADFFKQSLSDFPCQSSTRLLISGAADTGLMATICGCLEGRLSNAKILLADRCETVIEQNRRLADSLEVDAEFFVSEFSELQIAPVDVIVAHSLLQFFSFDQRQALLHLWSQLLRPGGRVLLSNSVYADTPNLDGAPKYQFDRNDVLAVANQMQFSQGQLTQLMHALSAMTEAGASTLVRPIEEELRDQIDAAGLEIKHWNRQRSDVRERGPYSSGDSTERLRIEAWLEVKAE